MVSFTGLKEWEGDLPPAHDPHPLVAVVWYRVHLDGKVTLSNHPCEQDACGHWSPIAVPLAPPKARSGRLKLEVKYGLSAFEDHLHVEILEAGRSLGTR
jgi:hypothetical protein